MNKLIPIITCSLFLLSACGSDSDTDADNNDPEVITALDNDKDGIPNKTDNCPTVVNPKQKNTDGDDEGDACDEDDDNDRVLDINDAFPLNTSESVDTDNDGVGNNQDTDDDNDGYSDADEVDAGTDPLDRDSKPKVVVAPLDNDKDGIPNKTDNCPTVVNPKQKNTDGDDEGDACDEDDDNDRVLDINDAFPLNASESVDTDNDGVGNNQDTDDDNDGYSDADEVDAGTDPLDSNSKPEINTDLSFNAEQRLIADQFISIFENGTTDISYIYAQDIDDGRGITAGRAGFTSATGDMLKLIKEYTENYPNNSLKQYIPELERLEEIYAKNKYTSEDCIGCDDTSGLDGLRGSDKDGYATDGVWGENALLPKFRKAQDDYVEKYKFQPTLEKAKEVGLKMPLSLLSMYDSYIQHGSSGLKKLIKKATEMTGKNPADGADELEWLYNFNINRKKVLKDKWSSTGRRVTELLDLIEAKNTQLKPFKLVIEYPAHPDWSDEVFNLPVK